MLFFFIYFVINKKILLFLLESVPITKEARTQVYKNEDDVICPNCICTFENFQNAHVNFLRIVYLPNRFKDTVKAFNDFKTK